MPAQDLSVSEEQLCTWLADRRFADCRRQLDRDGYLIFENVLSQADLTSIREALAPHLAGNIGGRNNFEGVRSNRIYALLAKSPVFAKLVIHPLALAFAEAELGRSCLLSALLAIQLNPGESVQPWHYDDAHINLPRPRPPCGLSAFWSIDTTSATNGATEVLPGSHLWPQNTIDGAGQAADFARSQHCDTDADPGARPDAVKAVMPAGSLMLAKGTLWHRGGANKSDRPRLIITPQYCPGWARQLENMCLAIPAAVAAALPERVGELLGYSIHPPFMGYVDGRHPNRLLDTEQTD